MKMTEQDIRRLRTNLFAIRREAVRLLAQIDVCIEAIVCSTGDVSRTEEVDRDPLDPDPRDERLIASWRNMRAIEKEVEHARSQQYSDVPASDPDSAGGHGRHPGAGEGAEGDERVGLFHRTGP